MENTVRYPLRNGGFTLIDREDLPKLSGYTWYQHCGYARARTNEGEVHLSHLLLTCPEGYEIDHINRNRLDNRKENLRIATRSENCANRGSFSHSSSRFKGVHWSKKSKRWEVAIRKDGRQEYIGSFDDEVAAASAYNHYAREMWGPFAVLNDIEEVDFRRLKHVRNSKHSQYLGVTRHSKGKWTARLTIEGKRKTLGYFDTEEDAARAFNDAYIATRGKEAPNIIESNG